MAKIDNNNFRDNSGGCTVSPGRNCCLETHAGVVAGLAETTQKSLIQQELQPSGTGRQNIFKEFTVVMKALGTCSKKNEQTLREE